MTTVLKRIKLQRPAAAVPSTHVHAQIQKRAVTSSSLGTGSGVTQRRLRLRDILESGFEDEPAAAEAGSTPSGSDSQQPTPGATNTTAGNAPASPTGTSGATDAYPKFRTRHPLKWLANAQLEEGKLVENGQPLVSPILARDACKCPKCIDASDRQRNFSYADIPHDISFRDITHIEGRDETIVRWLNDCAPHSRGDTTIFTREQIGSLKSEFRNARRWALYHRPQKLWDASSFRRDTSRIDFNDYMTDPATLAQTLHLLWRDGLVFIDGVPEEEASVGAIVNRIGPLQQTFYGPTWDVRSKPDPKNVAYTAKYLGFHMDLLYMRDPPGFQFLHCVHNSSMGGESRFADTFRAVDTLFDEDRAMVRTLMTYPVRYEYDNDGFFYSDAKPTILKRQELRVPHRVSIDARHVRAMKDVGHVFWSPPFVGNISPQPAHHELAHFVASSKAFAEIMERPQNVVEEKMDSGTCVIFDNLRVVHARNAFDPNSGRRWLRGAYLNRQDFISKAIAMMPMMPHVRFVDPEAD
ncbi:hypothetical protein HRR83_001744 [Exophiala dermatitidis]|uniref:Gamma-butyrobetaine dioxygenase n=2 Tax=Exophiala dermatitidis TaxID=5970 RepID=H6C5E5_EXODN|nr:gamma-butyrobetaine dioxygenase [Exophiala dermatitidis NIH/UT8656]KAJ4516414.1 hypothetical protein HRR73_004878 [Exophiala dermatitidis]EHY58992.1 gamma-butyrobetaine dioxygenase [Exophiala dermatitidis NIH/UT8656]KAJ4523212.1 hypothetical protein HRR75_001612 [Exophiala dermatitidis]KAJ4526549.1 hypothetical protein HRR74_001748 [Exophiala dermatitidis]KAJ4532204.1 hypothetical protein HRR76_007202 [Exophiala dermatitidis]